MRIRSDIEARQTEYPTAGAVARGVLVAVLALPAAALAEGSVWDWQLAEPFEFTSAPHVLDLDPDNHSPAELRALKSAGHELICYVSVGTVEDYRDDKDAFDPAVVGRRYEEWPDELFLDIRQLDVLLPIMRARFQRCADLGFEAIEPDNQDVHDNESGFDVSAEDTVRYLLALAEIAHGMGLTIGQKNIPELTGQLVDELDFVIAEDCFADQWCAALSPYVAAGKPVYAAEYTDTGVDFAGACAWGQTAGMSFILKDRDLTSYRKDCARGDPE